MIFRLFRPNPHVDSMACLYGTIVAQARGEVFYRDFGVPDTVNGRFEMVVLHTVLVLRRLDAKEAQALFDLFCRDMDDNLREIGVGDLGVPRQMRRIGEAFYGRRAAYEAALAAPDAEALVAALARNVYGADRPLRAGPRRLADYVTALVRALAAADGTALRRGECQFPDPAAVSGREPVTAGPAG
jgi:cytochrome b pre-mRNA-processing protein 3